MLYLISFFASFLTAFLALFLLVKITSYFKIKSRKNKRHIHAIQVSRLGGVAIILAFVIGILVNPYLVLENQHLAIILSGGIILIIGLADDFWKLDWKTQLFFQVAIAILIFILGIQIEYITNPWGGMFFLKTGRWLLPSLLLGIIWIVTLMNAMNWLDGLDGLAGGITLIGSFIIFALSLKPEVNQPPLAIISVSLMGAILAFLFFNFYPAKIMAGTSGSMFMGFILAVLAIFAGAKIATTLLVLILPLLDAFWVLLERFYRGTSLVNPDQRHLHYKLLKLGYSPRQIAFFFYGLTILMGWSALQLSTREKLKILLGVAFILVMTIIIVTNLLEKKSKKNNF